MNLNALIRQTLAPTNVPVAFSTYNNNASQYIIFNTYNEASFYNADDQEQVTQYFIQVDVFSAGDYTNLVKQVYDLMTEAGFGRMFASETYDEEAGKFRKIYRFSYLEKRGGI